MMGRRVVVVLGLLIVAVVGAALFLVLQDPAAMAPTADPVVAGANEEVHEDAAVKSPRRRAGHEGSAAIVGRLVRGKERAPVVGETVHLGREGTSGWTAVTAEDGRFRFERLPAGGPFELGVDAADCAPVRLPGLALDRREEFDAGDIRLDRAVPLTVVVKTFDDQPIAGALVEAYASADVKWGTDWTQRLARIGVTPVAVTSLRTNDQGVARFDALAVGSWAVRASGDGRARRGRSGIKLESEKEHAPVVLRLPQGHELAGIVSDGESAPLAGALVLLMTPNSAWNVQSAPLHFRAETDAEGRYAFEGLPEGDLALWAALPDGVPAQVAYLRIPDISAFDVELEPGGVLQGLVTEQESGEPVVGVEVRATGWTQRSQRVGVAVTDDEGRYRIDRMLAGIVNQVTVDRPGWVVVREGAAAQPWQQIVLNPGGDVTYDVLLRRAASVTGIVSSPDGPLADAKVSLHAMVPGGGWQSHECVTDASGGFSFDGVEEGRGLLQVRADGWTQPGFPSKYWDALNSGNLPEEWTVDIPKDGSATKNLQLTAGGSVSGHVTDAEAQPIAGAQVRVWSSSTQVSAETDESGAFSLTGLPLDRDVSVTASSKTHTAITQNVTLATGGPTAELDFELTLHGVVRGTVTAADGALLVDAYVQLGAPSPNNTNNPWNWQDPEQRWFGVDRIPVRPDGSYEAPMKLAKGQFVVRAGAAGLSPTESPVQAVVLGQDEYNVDLELAPGAPLTGSAIDAVSGEPVAGATVEFGRAHPMAAQQPWADQNTVRPIRAITAADGTFTLTTPASGTFKLTVRHRGHVETSKSLKLPTTTTAIAMELAPALAISGVVRFADGTAVPGASVTPQSEGNSQPTGFVQTPITTDAEGRFEVPSLPAGRYTLTVQSQWNGGISIEAHTTPTIDAGTSGLEIVVTEGHTISGTVEGPDGEPVMGTWVNAQSESPGDGPQIWRGAMTQADGAFEIVGISDGTFTLHVNSNDGALQAVQKKGIAAGTEGLRIVLSKGLEIRGRVVDETGQPIAGETILAMPRQPQNRAMSQARTATTAADGTFTIGGLATGDHMLQRQNSGNAERRNHVLRGGESVAAGTTGVELTLAAGVGISGVVVDASGGVVLGAKSMMVRARPVGTQNDKWGAVAADGTFAIEGLAEGAEYEISTMGGGFRPGVAESAFAGTKDVRVVVEPGLHTTGSLVDSRGDGIAGASVTFQRPGDSPEYAWGTTGADGSFNIGGLTEGSYSVMAWIQARDAEGNPAGRQRQVTLGDVAAGESGVRLEVPDAE